MSDQKNPIGAGMRFEGGSSISLDGNTVRGFEEGLSATNVNGLTATNNLFESRLHIKVDQPLLVDFLIQLQTQKDDGKKITRDVIEKQVANSKIRNWFIEHSVDVVTACATLYEAFIK